MSCNPPRDGQLTRSSRMICVCPCHLWACTMTTFVAGSPLAYSCCLSTSICWVSLACILLTSVSSLLELVHCPSTMYSMLVTSFSIITLYPINDFEAMLKFLLLVDCSGSLLLLKLSRSSRNLSIDSSSLCLLFSNRIIA